MKRNTVRWAIAVLMLLALTLGLSCPSIVNAEGAKLPLEFTEGGKPTSKENWTYDGKTPIAYKDSTIEVTAEKGSVTLPSMSFTWVISKITLSPTSGFFPSLRKIPFALHS